MIGEVLWEQKYDSYFIILLRILFLYDPTEQERKKIQGFIPAPVEGFEN
jgi:hypothetical protein